MNDNAQAAHTDQRQKPRTEANVATLRVSDNIAILEIDSPPVNALGRVVRAALLTGITEAQNLDCEALVLICAGKTFFAGADITEFGSAPQGPTLAEIFETIENSRIPVIAALHGTALGGGLELALSCHYRLAAASAKMGLPEVNLGLLPGAGGTQRAPRLIGLEKAIDMMLFGKPLNADAAKDIGLIDEIVDGSDLEHEAIVFSKALVKKQAPLRRVRDMTADYSFDDASLYIEKIRKQRSRLFSGLKAPQNILQAILASTELPFDEGLKRERQLFKELVDSPESAAQRYLFFAERMASKIPGLNPNASARQIDSVGVVGAGTMGTGISIALLSADLSVTLVDQDEGALQKGLGKIRKTLEREAAKGRISSETATTRISRLCHSTDIASLSDADLIIEAVFERIDLKKNIFRELDKAAKPDAILASNTSFLNLNDIAAETEQPARVVGMHFFSPANIMRLLEVVRGSQTDDSVLATAMALGKRLGKVCVVSGVAHGFIANRMMTIRAEMSRQLLLEGAMPWHIDSVMTDYGFAMGPFAMSDLVGLDVIGWDKDNSSSSTIQEILCEQGRWGQKTKAGYYDYTDELKPTPSPQTEQIIREFRIRKNIKPVELDDEEILRQLLFPVINEGARILDEGIAYKASDIDVALVTGYNWPLHTGGPMYWGDTIGLDKIHQWLVQNNIEPAALLVDLANSGRKFTR